MQQNCKRNTVNYETIPVGEDANCPHPGDFLLCHRKGLASRIIRIGEKIRFSQGAYWSHCAYVETPNTLIEALSHGVVRTPLSYYNDVEYIIVRTHMIQHDANQATTFARSCLGQKYGYLIDFAIALRFLTPGRGLWFGMNGTEICSGLVGQALVRGDKIFSKNPSSLSPTELAIEYKIKKP